MQSGQRRLVQVSPHGKSAHTRFRLLQVFPFCTYAEAELLTGRTHQIRAHAAYLGHALAGDNSYADRDSVKRWRERGLSRIFLHAHRVALEGPGGKRLEFNAPLPAILRGVLDALE